MFRIIPAACLLILLTGLSGCALKTHRVTGTVTRGGEKLAWADGGYLLVIFSPQPATRDKKVYSARTDTATSTFEIDAIPAGRYQVAVQQFNEKHADALRGVYDLGASPLTVEVTHDGQVIDIDLPEELPERNSLVGGGAKSGGGGGGGAGGGKGRRGNRGGDKPADGEKKDAEKKDDEGK